MRIKNLLMVMVLLLGCVLTSCGNEQTDVTSSTEVSSSEEKTQKAEDGQIVLTSTVHLREFASIAAPSITQIPEGSSVILAALENDWARVIYNGQEGYVLKEYLSKDGHSVTDSDVSPNGTPAASDTPESQEIPSSENAEVPSETSSEAASSEPSSATAPAVDPAGGVLTDNGMFDLTGLSNKSIPYGNDWDDKDSTGLPTGVHYYENMYGKYYPVYYIKTTEKVIYLTMDEGYEAGYTPTILDILKEKGVHAVFFLTKQFYDSDPELIQRMIDEGHTLGNHTINHPSGGYPKYVDEHGLQSFTDDVSTLHKLIYDSYGYSMRLFRFPEGESSELLMAKLNNLGYTSVFWSYAHRDYVIADQPDPAVTLQRCVDHLAPGAVYLLHAVSSSNTAALADFIDQARNLGYEFADFPTDAVSAR